MTEFLDPIISLYKLIIDGLKSISNRSKAKKKRDVLRKIIEIQLLLEDIIDNAREVLSTIQRNRNKKVFSQEESDVLRKKIRIQRARLQSLLNQLRDDISEKILKLFAPNIRRKIIDLIELKKGLIPYILSDLFRLTHFYKLEEKQFHHVYWPTYEWNHERFIRLIVDLCG